MSNPSAPVKLPIHCRQCEELVTVEFSEWETVPTKTIRYECPWSQQPNIFHAPGRPQFIWRGHGREPDIVH
jgi:hypothetical protein